MKHQLVKSLQEFSSTVATASNSVILDVLKSAGVEYSEKLVVLDLNLNKLNWDLLESNDMGVVKSEAVSIFGNTRFGVMKFNNINAWLVKFELMDSWNSSYCYVVASPESMDPMLGKVANMWIKQYHAGRTKKSVRDLSKDAIILDDAVKNKIFFQIDKFIEEKSLYKELMLPYKIGFLFYGNPGNGKTMLTRVIGKSYGFDIYMAENFYDGWTGKFRLPSAEDFETEHTELVRLYADDSDQKSLFLNNQTTKIVVFENIDKLMVRQGNPEGFITENDMTNELDGLDDKNGLILIGTSNYVHHIPDNIKHRPGRFDHKFMIPDPTAEQMKTFITRKGVKWLGKISELDGILKKLEKEAVSMAYVELMVKMVKLQTKSFEFNPEVMGPVADYIIESKNKCEDPKGSRVM
jgi:hypothetical protein